MRILLADEEDVFETASIDDFRLFQPSAAVWKGIDGGFEAESIHEVVTATAHILQQVIVGLRRHARMFEGMRADFMRCGDLPNFIE